MPERPGSVVKSMKRAIADLAPELLRDEKFAEARQYLRADHDKAEVARSKGLFHSEGARKDAEYAKLNTGARKVAEPSNISQKPFIAANRPLEKGGHGGWEGTFASRHGGFPHMFESLAPSKSKTWLGQPTTQAVNSLPILVPFASKGGPGYANRTISGDAPYLSDGNFDTIETLNRHLRLGAGNGFRPPAKPAGPPWMSAPPHSATFDGMAPFRDAIPPGGDGALRRRAGDAAREQAGRTVHGAPFVTSAWERRLPTDAFGRYAYMAEPYVDDPYKLFDHMVKDRQRQREAARGRAGNEPAHPPLRLGSLAAHSKPSPSIMFRRR